MLDDHILDCPICYRIQKKLMEVHDAYLPTSFEELVRCTPAELMSRAQNMPPVAIPAEDYDHYIARLAPPEDYERLLVNPYRILRRAGTA
jgi:hypothetical protein